MGTMLRSSLPLGSLLGVNLRLHISFVLLLALAVGYSAVTTGEMWRGVGLWLALVGAVAVREVARAIAAAYAGLGLRALFLHPGGGVMALAPTHDHAARQAGTKLINFAGPIANFAIGLLLMGAALAVEPHASLWMQPWLSFRHILRSVVWMQLAMGAVGLLPTPTAPSRQMLRVSRGKPGGAARTNVPAFSLGTASALAMLLAGVVLMNLWLLMLGAFLLLGAHLSASQSLSAPGAEAILVHQVMLTEYTLLSTSDTLQGALDRTVHSLQDVFPVVRGDRLVGSVSRQTLAEKLQAEGDGYLQGVMTRSLRVVDPSEKLVDALRRAAALGVSEFIPVAENGAMLGILTPQSLSRAVGQVKLTRPAQAGREQAGRG